MASKMKEGRTLGFLRRMLLIRRTEERIIHLAADRSLIRGAYFVYIGQEATAVGVMANLGRGDYVFTNHRNHGHILARGGSPGPVIAEVLGRIGGYAGGRGGPHHISNPKLGIVHTSAMVGGNVPLAVGAGLSIKRRDEKRVSLAFFGEATMEEGAFYEATNIASLWKLPVVLVCENNDAPPSLRSGAEIISSTNAARSLTSVARSFGILSQVVDGADITSVYKAAEEMTEHARGGEGPSFLEVRTTQWPGNETTPPTLTHGDYDVKWAWDADTAPETLREWVRSSDPVSMLIRTLLGQEETGREQIERIDRDVRREVAKGAHLALKSPRPTPKMAFEHLFA